MVIHKVGVVGCGLMGSGIAQVSAQGGFETVVHELDQVTLDKGLESIRTFLESGVDKGKLKPQDVIDTLERIKGSTDIDALGDCDLLIEAATERIGVKQSIYEELENICGPEAIFASNTSSLSITELATFAKRPDRFLGLHFFNPVPLMKLVEVVHTLQTSEATLLAASGWCQAIGKTVVTTRDVTGFVVNRLLVPYMLDAIREFERGLASRNDIDNAMKLGCGYPMGPLMLTDYVGLDTTHAIAEIMFAEFKEPRFAPPTILKRMVLAGHTGRKSGRGFYDWSTQPPS